MRLESFSVENYRSIRERVVVSGLGGVEIFHGDNNAGKSNLFGALALMWALLQDQHVLRYVGMPPFPDVGAAELGLRLRPVPHHDLSKKPTILEMTLRDPDLVVRFRLRFGEGERVWVEDITLQKDGQPWRPSSPEQPVELEGIAARLGPLLLPPEPFVVIDNLRQRLGGGSWDAWLLDAVDQDTEGSVRRRFQDIEHALGAFLPELGSGHLTRYRHASSHRRPAREPVELAWQAEDGRTIPFSEQGSGMRQMKDLLCAILGSPAQIIVLEEPETNLSEDAQRRLLDIVCDAAARFDKQILLTSHVYTFDGTHTRRVSREAGATRVSLPAASHQALAGTTAEALPSGWAAALQRAYASSGHPSAGLVATSGIMRLPEVVREALQAPEWMVFAPHPQGGFLAVPDHLLQAWIAQDEAEE